MKETKIKYIVITCPKYHDSRVSAIENSWGLEQDMLYLSDINLNDKIIGFPELKQGYENICLKLMKLIRTYNFNDKDWYFFCDDDTFVRTDRIEELIEKEYNEPVCLGIIGTLNPDATDKHGQYTGFPLYTIQGKNVSLPITYPSGGAGFLLNKVAICKLQKYLLESYDEDVPRSYNSDVTFGFWLKNSQIELINIEGFWWNNPYELKHDDFTLSESYTYHYITPEMMYFLKNKFNK